MILDILKTLPPILAGVISLGMVALRVVAVVLLYKIYKNTKKPSSQ